MFNQHKLHLSYLKWYHFFIQFNFSIVQCNQIIKCILWTSPTHVTNNLWQGDNYWFKILWTSIHVIIMVQLLHFNMCWLEAFPPLFGSLNINFKVNPSLSGTTRNITPWFSWIHQTLKNHKKPLYKWDKLWNGWPRFGYKEEFSMT